MRKLRKLDINSLIFACYLFAVWAIYIFVNHFDYGDSKRHFFLSISVCFAIVFPLAIFIIRLVRKITLNPKIHQYQRHVWCGLIAAFFTINLLIFLIWYAAYFPGRFVGGPLSQYAQAVTGEYNDWHPVLHTLIFFTLPLKLTGKAASIVLFQVIYFAAVLTYFSVSICRYFGIKVALIANAYIILNPFTGAIAMFPWKDIGFAIVALFIATSVFNIYFSKSEYLKTTRNLVLFVIMLALCTIFRHNAILYTLFVIIGVWSYSGRKLGARIALLTLVLIIGVKGPLYIALGVHYAGKRNAEIMGVPLTIMANVAKEGTDGLSQPAIDFIFSIATEEQYKEYYITGNFNSIKWNGVDLSIVEQTGIIDILFMTGECIVKQPVSSAKAFFTLTDMVYALGGKNDYEIFPKVAENNYGIEYRGNQELVKLLDNYKLVFKNTPLKFFTYIGSTVFLMLAFILGRCSFFRKSDWKKILLCIPILIYDFGTMLLLTGLDLRFFFVSFLVCPIVILIALDEQNVERQDL